MNLPETSQERDEKMEQEIVRVKQVMAKKAVQVKVPRKKITVITQRSQRPRRLSRHQTHRSRQRLHHHTPQKLH